MDTGLDDASSELARLRGCLNDLVSIMALPALSTAGEQNSGPGATFSFAIPVDGRDLVDSHTATT